MLQLTKRTEYGLIALIHLVDRADQAAAHATDGEQPAPALASAREIGERFPIPRRVLAEVLKDLARSGLIDSQRGATGGYALAHPPEETTVGHVVAALEGRPRLTGCESLPAWGASGCEVEPVCPIKSPIGALRERLWELMQHTSLRDLATQRSKRSLQAALEPRS